MFVRGLIVTIVLILSSPIAMADEDHQVHCDHGKRLAKTLEKATPGETIQVRGTCHEAVTITTDRVTLDGGGSAVIDGGGAEAVTVDGARGVTPPSGFVTRGDSSELGPDFTEFTSNAVTE